MTISKLTFAGHSAVILEGEKSVGLDPWLASNPICPDELKKPASLDLIVLSHGHADHAGDAVDLAVEHDCKVAATFELATLLGEDGVDQDNLVLMNKGGKVEIEGFEVHFTNAFHSSSYITKDGVTHYAGEPCGIVIDDGTSRIYHAGDTCLFSDLELIGRRFEPDLVCLPIGDCFTMGPEDAADAAKLLGAKRVLPMHYATFPLLTGTVEDFRKACAGQDLEVIALEPGQSMDI